MNVRTFYTSPIETNTYICHNDGSSEAIAIDVGEYIEDIKKYLIKNKLILKYIILTLLALLICWKNTVEPKSLCIRKTLI